MPITMLKHLLALILSRSTSMNIYTSEKVLPYVYRLDNPITGEFYIGYRAANKVPSEQDLGLKYFTSAPKVKLCFSKFQTLIIAEFFEPNDAYDYEQYLIYCNLGNPLMLNKKCYYKSKSRFNNTNSRHSDETRLKISNNATGKKRKPRTEEHKKNLTKSALIRPPMSITTRQKISISRKGVASPNKGKKGKPRTEEQKKSQSIAMLGDLNPSKRPEVKRKQSLAQKTEFFSIIETKKTYNKSNTSRYYPELRPFF